MATRKSSSKPAAKKTATNIKKAAAKAATSQGKTKKAGKAPSQPQFKAGKDL
jgi:hypothetical protein